MKFWIFYFIVYPYCVLTTVSQTLSETVAYITLLLCTIVLRTVNTTFTHSVHLA